MVKYDLELFKALNEEYRSKPTVAAPRKIDVPSLISNAELKANQLIKNFNLSGKCILEVGCGRGELADCLQRLTASTIFAVDINRHNEWELWRNSNVTYRALDLTANDQIDIGTFDFIYSIAALEHVRHPYSMLKAIHSLLNDSGTAYLYFNLYRGPLASHCYRHVFFPWPHLLFDDSVFEAFYQSIGMSPSRPSWVNQLSIADYLNAFSRLDFKVSDIKFSESKFDEEFYLRFEDKLGRFPRYDLNKNFIHVTLQKQ